MKNRFDTEMFGRKFAEKLLVNLAVLPVSNARSSVGSGHSNIFNGRGQLGAVENLFQSMSKADRPRERASFSTRGQKGSVQARFESGVAFGISCEKPNDQIRKVFRGRRGRAASRSGLPEWNQTRFPNESHRKVNFPERSV